MPMREEIVTGSVILAFFAVVLACWVRAEFKATALEMRVQELGAPTLDEIQELIVEGERLAELGHDTSQWREDVRAACCPTWPVAPVDAEGAMSILVLARRSARFVEERSGTLRAVPEGEEPEEIDAE